MFDMFLMCSSSTFGGNNGDSLSSFALGRFAGSCCKSQVITANKMSSLFEHTVVITYFAVVSFYALPSLEGNVCQACADSPEQRYALSQ